MIEATYKMTGDESVTRFISRNRPSTDALGALTRWRDQRPGRSFEVLEDEDDHLIVKLSLHEDDDLAGPALQALGAQHGVKHEFIAPGASETNGTTGHQDS